MIAVKAGGGLISHERCLGISAYPAEQVVQRYDQRCQVTLSAIMLEAEGDVIEAAAAPPRLPQPHRLPSPLAGWRPQAAQCDDGRNCRPPRPAHCLVVRSPPSRATLIRARCLSRPAREEV